MLFSVTVQSRMSGLLFKKFDWYLKLNTKFITNFCNAVHVLLTVNIRAISSLMTKIKKLFHKNELTPK